MQPRAPAINNATALTADFLGDSSVGRTMILHREEDSRHESAIVKEEGRD